MRRNRRNTKYIIIFIIILIIVFISLFYIFFNTNQFEKYALKENVSYNYGVIEKYSDDADSIEIIEASEGYTLTPYYLVNINKMLEQDYKLKYLIDGNEIDTILLSQNQEIRFELTEEKQYNLELQISKNGEDILKWSKNIFYIKPYEKQFLDEWEKNSTILHVTTESVENELPQSIELLNAIGMTKIRISIMWAWIERNGTYNFSEYDKKLNILNNNGFEILGVIDTNDSPYNGTDKMIASEDEIAKYISFVDALSKKFPFIHEYEIGNELNTRYTGEEGKKAYARLVIEANKVLNANNKQNKIIAGATVQVSSRDFLEGITKYGAYKNSNGFSYHIYRHSITDDVNGGYREYLNKHKGTINSLGGFQKIYITETGVSDGTSQNTPIEDKAEILVQQSIIRDEKKIEEGVIYNFRDTGKSTSSTEQNYGIIENDYTPKLSYYSLKNYYENTNGAEYIGTINLADGLEAHVYDKDGKPKIITWTPIAGDAITINYQGFTAKDLYGNVIENINGTLMITNSPVYLDNISDEYFYQAISNTATEKYNEFEEKFSE